MSDEKKNDVVEAEQTNRIEVKPLKNDVVKPESNANGESGVIQNDAKSQKGDLIAYESVSEGSADGCEEERSNVEELLMDFREQINTVAEKLLETEEEMEELNAEADISLLDSDSDIDDLHSRHADWSKYRKKFEKCLTKLRVRKEDIKEKPFEELCKTLVPQTSLYRERRKFYYANRAPKESNEDFIKRLTDLSNTCQFGKRQDLAIADVFIVNVMDSLKYSSLLPKKSQWTDLKQEVDCKKALEIAENEEGEDEMETILARLSGRGKGKKIPRHLSEMIRNEIMEKDVAVEWNDIAGLEFPKSVIKESIVWPMLRPDIFTGLRKLPKAILLFGPPGTGKTMIAKCIAAQSKSTFFYVSASTMASKWHGESEQLVRALFTVAAEHQPSVIFFDEVDSILTQRKSEDHEVNRRVKTEFMVHLDGAATKDDARVIFIGATNRPQDLDEAARRRFVKRLYIPLPNLPARQQLLTILLKNHRSNMTDDDVNEIATMTNEFSGADIKWLCQDAAMEPLRSIPDDKMMEVEVKDIRPLEMSDFVTSLKRIRPSVASKDLTAMVEWDRLYGTNPERPCLEDNHFMYS